MVRKTTRPLRQELAQIDQQIRAKGGNGRRMPLHRGRKGLEARKFAGERHRSLKFGVESSRTQPMASDLQLMRRRPRLTILPSNGSMEMKYSS